MRLLGLALGGLACAIVAGCIAADVAPTNAPSSPTAATACDPTGELPSTDFTSGTASFDGDNGRIQATLSLTADGTFLPSYSPSCPAGAQAEWASASDEWHLTVLSNAEPNDAFGGQRGTLWIERYGPEPPLHADGTSCATTITEVSPAGLVGKADCLGMRWLNEYEAETQPDASPLPDYAPFDISISFEARP